MVIGDRRRMLRCVEHYRKIGLCPLPSRMTGHKGPMLSSYAEHYNGVPVPEWVYDQWDTTNAQIITGAKSPTKIKVVVVDLDGTEALEAWNRIATDRPCARKSNWESMTGGGGRHLWFLLPPDTTECPSGIIWGLWDTWGDTGKGRWCKHKEIRILGDNSLVVAPPSVHVESGRRYEFICGRNPNRLPLPQVAPKWLLEMPRLAAPRTTDDRPYRPPAQPTRYFGQKYTRDEVLNAVGDFKFELARREWGLVSPVSGPNGSGWCQCFVPGREDPRYSRASGSFNYADGTFQDRKDMTSISFFDLGVLLGHFQTWQDCRDTLGDRFIGRRGV